MLHFAHINQAPYSMLQHVNTFILIDLYFCMIGRIYSYHNAFYCIFGINLLLRTFWKENDPNSLIISEIIVSERRNIASSSPISSFFSLLMSESRSLSLKSTGEFSFWLPFMFHSDNKKSRISILSLWWWNTASHKLR